MKMIEKNTYLFHKAHKLSMHKNSVKINQIHILIYKKMLSGNP